MLRDIDDISTFFLHVHHKKPDIYVYHIPFVSDQPVNALQVEKLGLGKVLDYKDITADKLRETAMAVMEDHQIRENLQKIQKEIAQAPGNAGTVRIIEESKYMR